MTETSLSVDGRSPHAAGEAADTPSGGAESLDALRQRLVLAALKHVPFDGWSDKALRHAATDLGLDASAPARLFSHRASSAVHCFTALADALMVQDIAAADLTELNVRERIVTAIRLRLERWTPHRETVRRALAVYALPQNMLSGIQATWCTADQLWKAIGDRSADFSWYTKRASLTTVYSATLLYWLDDPSENHTATWSFLARRVDDVVKAIQFRQKAGKTLTKTLQRLANPWRRMPRQRSGTPLDVWCVR